MSFVYFVRNTETREVKIGYGKRPAIRMSQIQMGCTAKVEMAGMIPGGREEERKIHAVLRGYRKGGEWFAGHYPVYLLIEKLANGELNPSNYLAWLDARIAHIDVMDKVQLVRRNVISWYTNRNAESNSEYASKFFRDSYRDLAQHFSSFGDLIQFLTDFEVRVQECRADSALARDELFAWLANPSPVTATASAPEALEQSALAMQSGRASK
jgi:hypothetical protein